MKTIFYKTSFVLCSALMIFSFFAAPTDAQIFRRNNSESFRTIAAKITPAKNQNKPFTIITPDDLSKLSAAELNVLTSSSDPCETATPINFNQPVNGQLTNADCRLDDGSYADFYSFNGTAGQEIRISLNSDAFDTYLGLSSESGSYTLEDDDSGGGTNSLIITNLPATGTYIILANSIYADQFGGYTLNLSATCTYTLNPSSATIAPEGGTYTFEVITQFGCQWTANTGGNSFLSSTSSGTGSGTATYTAAPNGTGGTRVGTIAIGGGQSFTVTQPPINCVFSINPMSANLSAESGTYEFAITTQPGCFWQAQYNGNFISTQSSGAGSGTIVYSVTNNNGAERTGTITVGGQTFTITQAGLTCTFSVSPTEISVDRFENYGSITVTTQPGCFWSAGGASSWIMLDRLSGTGSATINYRIYGNQYPSPRTGLIPIYGNDLIRVNVTQSAVSNRTNFDFDFDGKADFAVYRPSDGIWYINQSNNGFTALQFGSANDLIAPGDYDGDGKTDIAVFRGGTWFIQRSELGFIAVNFGTAGDVPVPADFDLDGKTDIAVFRPSDGFWFVYSMFNNNLMFTPKQFGISTDVPVVGDYDGDGKADYAVYRPSDGIWFLLQSRDGFAAFQFGVSIDKAIPADYDGDGKTDIAVFRPSDAAWYILNSSNGQFSAIQFGLSTDVPVPADYDGDGKDDVAVYRGGTWFIRQSASNFNAVQFGTADDQPVPNAFIR